MPYLSKLFLVQQSLHKVVGKNVVVLFLSENEHFRDFVRNKITSFTVIKICLSGYTLM